MPSWTVLISLTFLSHESHYRQSIPAKYILAASYTNRFSFPVGSVEVGAFYWTALAPEIVNSRREGLGSLSV